MVACLAKAIAPTDVEVQLACSLVEAVCVAYFVVEFAVKIVAFGRSFFFRWEQKFGVEPTKGVASEPPQPLSKKPQKSNSMHVTDIESGSDNDEDDEPSTPTATWRKQSTASNQNSPLHSSVASTPDMPTQSNKQRRCCARFPKCRRWCKRHCGCCKCFRRTSHIGPKRYIVRACFARSKTHWLNANGMFRNNPGLTHTLFFWQGIFME